MIAVDSSVLIDLIKSRQTPEMLYLKKSFVNDKVCMPPVVISEILSNPKVDLKTFALLQNAPKLSIHDGYWVRAGQMRSKLIQKGFKPKLPDTLIAQSCIDHDCLLLTRDQDFQKYEEHCGLRLAKVGE